MSAKILSSLTDENRNLRKQIGCMNGLFQIFDRRHLLSGRRTSSHNQTRPLDLLEQKEKPRASADSARPSNSSPRHLLTSEIQFQRISTKEKQSVVTKNLQSPDLRDVVKESMNREARSSTKAPANIEKRSNVVKQQHVDSPRPLRHSRYGKPSGYEELKDDQLTLPRFSYDGRDTKNASKTTTRLKELPRLSLDSRASAIKLSSYESRSSDFLDRFHVEHENCSSESGSHRRSSSVVAKLMGLESFPEPDSTVEYQMNDSVPKPKETLTSRSFKPDPDQLQNVSQTPASPSPRLRYAESFQGSPKMASQGMKAPTTNSSSPHPSSVYGEIEKRIAELEFKKSGKDLRALKQILEAMQKTRERIENQREESAEMPTQRRSSSEYGSFDRNLWQNRKIDGPSPPKSVDRVKFTSSSIIYPVDVMHVQRLQNLETKNRKENLTQRSKARALEPRNNSQLESINKKSATRKYMEQDRILKGPLILKINRSTNSSFGTSSPRFHQISFQGEESSRPNTPSSEPVRIRNHSSKKVVERNSLKDKKHRPKSKTPRFSDIESNDVSSDVTNSSYHGDTASQKSESNYSLSSQVEANNAVEQQQKYVKTRREQMSPVQLEEISMEQPSPVSVLDATFYTEDPPSPVRKITLAFQDDEDPSSDETEYQGSDIARPYTPKIETSITSVHKVRLSNIDQQVTSSKHDASLVPGNSNTDHLYNVVHTLELLRDTINIPTARSSGFSCQLISPEMFHALEMEAGKIVKSSSNQKNDTKLIHDTVTEMLSRKITSSGGLYSFAGRKRSNPHDLMKEVCSELNSLSKIQSCNLDDAEEDLMIELLASDMKHESEDWTSHKSEVPTLVLDIERLIFKDLINEVLTNTQHCRQRFTYY